MPQVKLSFRTKEDFVSEYKDLDTNQKYHLIDDRLNIIIPGEGITQHQVDQEIEKLNTFFENQ